MSRIFVLGDVHGALKALLQCFERAEFSYEHDQLIALGDVCDGWPETRECLDELMKVKNLIYILGNHDTWFRQWLKTGRVADIWYEQGGKESIESYRNTHPPESHKRFFDNAVMYHILENKIFVHAGFDPEIPLQDQGEEIFLWDRTLARSAVVCITQGKKKQLTEFEEVFIGHTPVFTIKPVQGGGVWLMDTGAGWQGNLSMMDVHSKEMFTSDPVPLLYPGVTGRRKY